MKILVLSESVSLAHIVRPLVISEILSELDYEVIFAFDHSEFSLSKKYKFSSLNLKSIGKNTFLNRISKQKNPYLTEDIENYVKDDCEIIQKTSPDLIISDFRNSLLLQPEEILKNVVVICNSYWGLAQFNDYPPIPFFPLCLFSSNKTYRINSLFGKIIDKIAAKPFNDYSKFLGSNLKKLFSEYTFPSETKKLLLDPPELVTFKSKNSNIGGFCNWTPLSCKEISDYNFDVFVNLGSSGPTHLLPSLIKVIDDSNLNSLILSSDQSIQLKIKNASLNKQHFFVDYVDGVEAAGFAKIIICNGGSPSLYQALSSKASIISIPSNFDQAFCCHMLNYLEGIYSIPIGSFSISKFKKYINQAITDYPNSNRVTIDTSNSLLKSCLIKLIEEHQTVSKQQANLFNR
jgi:UDP:flavonoid glycosyltransferase YjiC (YdhE family)